MSSKEELALQVERDLLQFRALKDSMKTKDYHQTTRKCSNCGKSFNGKGNADTCGGACRVAKHRS